MDFNFRERVSVFAGVHPHPIAVQTLPEVFACIQSDPGMKEQTQALRCILAAQGKDAFDRAKCRLPAVTFGGIFRHRAKAKAALVDYSGLGPLDIDKGLMDPAATRVALMRLPWIVLAYVSPSGRGVKAVARYASTDPLLHDVYTLHACRLIRESLGDCIDKAQHDYSRLSFLAGDSEAWFRPDGARLMVPDDLLQPLKPERTNVCHRRRHSGITGQDSPLPAWQADLRQHVAERVLGEIEWVDAVTGYFICPGADKHTHADKDDDCRVVLSGVPSVSCFHTSCAAEIAETNRELRSRIGTEEKRGYAIALRNGGAE
ncbi:MAG: hypothetical protein KF833_08500 [Verrucomicrobiae bacterium]|nr:hypothetical protein [Verrucomicrobiae bacterium]